MLSTKNIGNKITEARKKAAISQAQLAEHLFISPQAVGKWERGESMPDIITLNRLAEILGVDLNYFSESFQSVSTDSTAAQENELDAKAPTAKAGKKLSWDMSRGNWVDADFSGLNNLKEKFSSSNMQRCQFIGSDLSGLLLKSNNIDSCDFSESDISNSQIRNSNIVKSSFKNSAWKETEFSGSYIMGCDFSGTDFSGAVFKTGGLQNNTLTNAIWNGTSFNAMHLAELVFEGELTDCSFENCSFKKVTFQNTRLTNTFFKGILKRVQFIDCKVDKLTYAFLKTGKADLSGVILTESETE